MDITTPGPDILRVIETFTKDKEAAGTLMLFMMCHGTMDEESNYARPRGLNVEEIVKAFCSNDSQQKVLF